MFNAESMNNRHCRKAFASETRPGVVENAERLVRDPTYPSDSILQLIASVLSKGLAESDGPSEFLNISNHAD
jgi:hypothetical protein